MVKKSNSLVDQFKDAIRESGLTSYRIGKVSGVGQPLIDRFMTGERDIRLETAAKIASVLELELRKRDS